MPPFAQQAAAQDCSARYTLFSPTPDACLEEIFTDRPHRTDTPAILAPGHAQAEIGVVEYGYSAKRQDELTVWNTQLKLGISPRLDLEMFYAPISTQVRAPEAFPSDAAFRAKLQLLEALGDAFLLTLVPYAEVSRGELSAAGGYLFFGYDFASGLELELNVGDTLELESNTHALLATAAATFPVAPSTAFFAELFTETSLDTGHLDSSVDIGLLYAVARDVQLDAGVYLGLTGDEPTATPFLGTSFRL